MHHPAYLNEESICVPYDSIIEGMLRDNAVPYERRKQKLDGLRANFAARHEHKHSHGRDE
jgi:urease accessory protein UreE